ncbi:MAG: hypothetical protein ACXVCY_15685 [Pseudobdellovibrionaceae bacterium]
MRILILSFMSVVTIMLAYGQAAKAAPTCALTSEGIFKGAWVKHRIVLDEKVIYGADDVDSILSQLESLRETGLCR